MRNAIFACVVVGVVVALAVVVTVSVTVVVPLPQPAARASVTSIGDNRAMRPIIGITAYAEEATWGVWTQACALVPQTYVLAVERVGGRPLIVPPSDEGVEETLAA